MIFGIVVIVALATILSVVIYFKGITTNTAAVTADAAIWTIVMMAITAIFTEIAIKNIASKGLEKLSITLEAIGKEQDKFHKVIYNYLYPQPKISLRFEIRNHLIIFKHYYLWVYNVNCRNVKIEISPKPEDSSGLYQFNQEP